MTYCYRCGRRIKGHYRICPHCGAYAYRHTARSNLSGIVIRVIIIIVLIVVFIMILNSR